MSWWRRRAERKGCMLYVTRCGINEIVSIIETARQECNAVTN